MPRRPSVETMMANDEASRGLGIELIDSGEGRAVTRMTVRGDMVNGHAMVVFMIPRRCPAAAP